MSDRDISEILGRVRRLDKGATPVPWGHPSIQDGEMLPDGTGYAGAREEYERGVVRLAGPDNEEEDVADCDHPGDAALIVAYRADALALADEVERLLALRDVPYRPGLPTVEQVRAHAAANPSFDDGFGRWQYYSDGGLRLFDLGLLDDETLDVVEGGCGYNEADLPSGGEWRPCLPNGTPWPWGDR